MERRHLLLVAALLSALVFMMPNVFSVFAGQHWFYDKGVSYCLKCHSDIKQELDSSTHHTSFTCENCHVLDTGSNQTHGNVINPRCLDCHATPPRTVTNAHNTTFLSPVAKIFGENIANRESHIPFVASANTTTLMEGENEACVSCHTTKSLSIKMLYSDTYRFNANRIIDSTWALSDYSKNNELSGTLLIQSNESAGKHLFPSLNLLKCEKCHYNIRYDLNNSFHHTYFSCNSCHQLYPEYHSSSIPPCLICHGINPRIVIDQKGSTFIARTAPVYAGGAGAADAHLSFVSSANNSNLSEGTNSACSACHSSFNLNISFRRPGYIEWDVVKSKGKWIIQNLRFGHEIEVRLKNYLDVKSHNISMESNVNCVSCHEDIEQAVVLGGHSNEQWKQKHDYKNFSDMDSYCKSCHKPITQDKNGNSPYPAYPFNSQIHDAMKISCMDCHGKSGDLFAYFNGMKEKPIYNGANMGNVEDSIGQQPAFVQSYLCIACKNTGNPAPSSNNPLHFKLYTEPQVTIYINGTQRYP